MKPSYTRVRALALILTFGGLVLAQDATIEVDAGKPAGYTIPRTIFGTFLEPIGNSIYGGLWAQVLANPSFEDNLWSAGNVRTMLEKNAALVRASQLGLPLPWEPLDQRQGARYEPRWNDAANGQRSLLLIALPTGETGVRQEVFLPVHRTLRYQGIVWARHISGQQELTVSIRRRNQAGNVLARAVLKLEGSGWKRYEFMLTLERDAVTSLEPADFAITVAGETRVLVDQVLLAPADHLDGMDPEIIALSRELRTPVVRYGGNFTSAYHWRDGIGPLEKRISMLNLAWGMPEYNHFGTDEFLTFCKRIGAEPQIALNLGTGTPEEAAGWVRYVNERWGSRGLYWELGNELWGNFQTGYPTESRIAALTKVYSDAVRRVDKSAKLIATGQDPDHFESWNSAQLANPTGTFDLLSTHFVMGMHEVLKKEPASDFIAYSAFAVPVELERRLRAMRQQIGDRKVHIAFTEWLFWGRQGIKAPYFDNLGGAICTAGMLNTLMRTAEFTPVSDMTGLVEFGGIWKKRGRVYGVPAYWAFRMYSTADASKPVSVTTTAETFDVHEGNRRLPEVSRVPYLDVVAALNDAGDRLTLFCINRHLERDLKIRVNLNGFRASDSARVQTLSSASIYDTNSEEHPDFIRPVESQFNQRDFTFPRASVTVIEFRKER